ncbi:MAG: deoxynucleoside kinase [bacterium]|nr:deoxynucleoside kinase [bacterium]
MYIIEGNIGAGKSTLLQIIAKKIPEFTTIAEPIDQWKKQLYGQSLLYNFYEQPRRWAYSFELLTLMSRIKDMLNQQKKEFAGIPILERSIYSGYYCFAKNSHMQGFLIDLEWHIYQESFKFLVSEKITPPRGFIYLRVNPEVAYERVKKRNRYAEKSMSLRYLKQIHERHEEFLIEKIDVLPELKNIPVLTFDCNEEFENDEVRQAEFLGMIKNFCGTTLGEQLRPLSPENAHQKMKCC